MICGDPETRKRRKMPPGINVEIAMGAYIAVALSLVYGFGWATFFSVASASLSLAIMMTRKDFGEPDSWGWSKAATNALLVGAAIFLVGGLPLLGMVGKSTCPLGLTRFWQIAAVLFTTVIMAIATYLRHYLGAAGIKTASLKSLELEYQQWLHMLRALIVLTGVMFVAGGGMAYVVRLPTGLPAEMRLPPLGTLVVICCQAFGWLVWILRPIFGRLKEIRDRINELYQKGVA